MGVHNLFHKGSLDYNMRYLLMLGVMTDQEEIMSILL